MMNMTLALQLQAAAEKALTKPRITHVYGVVDTVTELAIQYGVPPHRAIIAAWLHDLAREWSTDRLLQTAETVDIPTGFATIPALLHGPIAAYLGRTSFGIDDEDILTAVCYHTTGRIDMSLLEKILFVADSIEPNRNYQGIDDLRGLAKENLDLAVLRCMESSITHLLHVGQPIFPLTVMARNILLSAVQRRS
jgi:predicted HD superfamily hydrolase involved in NAD metabolism